jgi:Domain of unknown function (DUF4282)
MQPQGFLASLFDFSFTTFITGRIIKILYVLSTIIVALWTLAFVLFAFKASTGFGIITLVLLAPLFFLFSMIYVRVVLELIMVIFRIHAPSGFETAHGLLIRSFDASLADDEALVAWTVARRNGGNGQALFAQANRLGARATALKRQFLREYGPRRRIATGQSPRTLPTDF